MIARTRAATRNAMMNRLRDDLDGGTVEIYSGAIPSTPETALAGQVRLGVVSIAAPAAADASDGTLVLQMLEGADAQAEADGTATWARLRSAAGAAIQDVDVGDEASSAALKMNTVQIVHDGPLRVRSLRMRFG